VVLGTIGVADIRSGHDAAFEEGWALRSFGEPPTGSKLPFALFKIAAHDDLSARDLLLRCLQALDDGARAVLAHSVSTVDDSSGGVVGTFGPGMTLNAPRAADRFWSVRHDLSINDPPWDTLLADECPVCHDPPGVTCKASVRIWWLRRRHPFRTCVHACRGTGESNADG
jgi:hypothetical protein